MNRQNVISVQEFYNLGYKKLQLSLVAGDEGLSRPIKESSLNRPALALFGYFKYFGNERIQVFGAGEMGYLRDQKREKQEMILISIIEHNIPCIVVSRNLVPSRSMLRISEDYKIPLFRTPLTSKEFATEATLALEQYFAPKTKLHGTLMDVKGMGTLLMGKSGMGKSECALALIERGYSLVSDDLVNVERINNDEIVGQGSELNQGYMECRGLGILSIADLFGIRAIRLKKRIDLVIVFVEWSEGVDEDRTGLERDYIDILEVRIPKVTIYVRPGRDLARLVEVASMVEALRLSGHDCATEFNEGLIKAMQENK